MVPHPGAEYLVAAAARVAAKRRELELRLQQLHQAPIAQKISHANIVAATIYELFDHQAAFNDLVVGRILALESRVAITAPLEMSRAPGPPL